MFSYIFHLLNKLITLIFNHYLDVILKYLIFMSSMLELVIKLIQNFIFIVYSFFKLLTKTYFIKIHLNFSYKLIMVIYNYNTNINLN